VIQFFGKKGLVQVNEKETKRGWYWGGVGKADVKSSGAVKAVAGVLQQQAGFVKKGGGGLLTLVGKGDEKRFKG